MCKEKSNLISFSTMARIENHVSSSKVQACFVTSDLASLAQHPVLSKVNQAKLALLQDEVSWLKVVCVSSKNS